VPSPSASILPFAGNIARSEHVMIYYLLSISFLILVPSSSASILPFVGNIARSEHVITYYLLFIMHLFPHVIPSPLDSGPVTH
jgi:membrane protein DedA with SNARE-associated domain